MEGENYGEELVKKMQQTFAIVNKNIQKCFKKDYKKIQNGWWQKEQTWRPYNLIGVGSIQPLNKQGISSKI